MTRLISLDILRGYAVLVMLLANTAAYFLQSADSYYVRLLFSTAAPIFIFLSGFTTEMNLLSKKEGIRFRTFKRSLQVLLLGVLIDVLFWNIFPFSTFDVLYLIALAQMTIIALNYSKSVMAKWIGFFAATVLFFLSIYSADYRFSISESALAGNSLTSGYDFLINSLKRMFIDGWFPVLPWISFAIAGAIAYHYRLQIPKNSLLVCASCILTVFVPALLDRYKDIPIRDNYLEIWYPPYGSGFILAAGCVLTTILAIPMLNNTGNNPMRDFLMVLGKNSLFIYTIHALLISVTNKLNPLLPSGIPDYALFMAIVLAMIILGFIIEKVKTTEFWLKIPRPIKYLLGY